MASTHGTRQRPIVINGRFLTQNMTGVQRFAEELTRQLLLVRDDVVVACPPGQLRDSFPARYREQVGRLSGHAWEQVDLPRYLASRGSPPLVSLGSSGPMRVTRQISTHHDITYLKYPESFSRAFRLWYRVMVPRVLQHSQALVTVSDFSRQEIATHFGIDPSRFTVIHNAVADRFVPPASKQDRPRYLLAVSSTSGHKNHETLLAAYRQYYSRCEKPAELLIVGGHHRSTALGLPEVEDGVRFLGRVSDADLVELYQQAQAFVFPSRYEGFGIPPLEAQACGAPVLASRAAAIPEVLDGSAIFFDPSDAGQLADLMLEIGQDRALRERTSEAGRENVRRFSWEKSARQLSDLIDQTFPA